jgi:GT2 family glycosyltransferase
MTNHASSNQEHHQSTNRQVSTVIPTYNGLELLKKHLPFVLSCLRSKDQLIIVDDDSSDQTVDWLRKKFQLSKPRSEQDKFGSFKLRTGLIKQDQKEIDIKVMANDENIRFAANSNRGVMQADHQLIFLINNDVAPTEDVLSHLVPHFSDPAVFAVGCLEIESDQDLKGGKNKLYFKKGMFIHQRADQFNSGPTAWASGGSAMFDANKWSQLDGFDLNYYPAYWEDVDLSYRAKQQGWKVLFESEAVVYHNHESTNRTELGMKQMDQISWRNANQFVWKNGGCWQKLQHLLWKPYWWYQRNLKQ